MRLLVAQERQLFNRLGSVRKAIVALSPVAYGMARMYQTMMDGSPVEVEVFRDLQEARRWLGVQGIVGEAASPDPV